MKEDFHIIKCEDYDIVLHAPTSSILKVHKDFDLDNDEKLDYLSKHIKSPNIERWGNEYCKKDRCGLLVLNITETCNLKCKYCFANGGSYNSEKKVMDLDILKKSVKYVLDNYKDGIRTLSFFGGEPLIAINNIKEIVKYTNEECERRNIKRPDYALITNGTLVDEDTADFLNNNFSSITVSIDGNKDLNDYARISDDNRSVYEKIKDGLELVNKDRKYLLTTESTINKIHIDNYRPGIVKEWLTELLDLGFDSVSFFAVDSNDASLKISDRETLHSIFTEYVDTMFEFLENDNYHRFASQVLGYIYSIVKKKYAHECGAGTSQVFINTSGEIYPCQLYYQARKYRLGSIEEDFSIGHEMRNTLIKDFKRENVDECKECFAKNLCTSWCAGSSILAKGKVYSVLDTRCWTQKAIIEAVIRNLVRLKTDNEKWNIIVERLKECNGMYTCAR